MNTTGPPHGSRAQYGEPRRERQIFGTSFFWNVTAREPDFRQILSYKFTLMRETGVQKREKQLFFRAGGEILPRDISHGEHR